jgi:hypothetical protein
MVEKSFKLDFFQNVLTFNSEPRVKKRFGINTLAYFCHRVSNNEKKVFMLI